MSTSTEHPLTSSIVGTNEDVDTESNKRSERKRRREKQRRSDLSNAFDELAAFIVQVEPGSGEDETDKKGKKRKSSDGGEDSAGITRLDLIGRALRIMKRLYRENEERKRVIATIEGRGGGANDSVSETLFASEFGIVFIIWLSFFQCAVIIYEICSCLFSLFALHTI